MKTKQKQPAKLVVVGSARVHTKALTSGSQQEPLMSGRYD